MNMSLQDIGLRAMYNYHVNKTLQNRKNGSGCWKTCV